MKNLILLTAFITLMGEGSEKSINELWCLERDGMSEYRTSYGTYVDCLTEDLAIEVEYDHNSAQKFNNSKVRSVILKNINFLCNKYTNESLYLWRAIKFFKIKRKILWKNYF